jgi:hypothetical protein
VSLGGRTTLSEKRILVALIVALAGMPGAGRAAAQAGSDISPSSTDTDTSRVISPGSALLRSALIPGWGQAYVGHYAKAGILFAGGATTLALTLRADGRVGDLAARRTVVIDPLERNLLEADIEYWRGERRRWILWSLAVWVYSMLDAYVDAHLHNFDAVEPVFTPPPTPDRCAGPGRIYVGLRISLESRKRFQE